MGEPGRALAWRTVRLVHWSTEGYITEVAPPARLDRRDKPLGGFWVSDEDEYGWRSWCLDEEYTPRADTPVLATEVTLAPHRTLYVPTATAFDAFVKAYVVRSKPYGGTMYWSQVDWHRVARCWGAVVISPYRTDRRLLNFEMSWYAGWDCASGVVLDPGAVTALTPRPDWSWEKGCNLLGEGGHIAV